MRAMTNIGVAVAAILVALGTGCAGDEETGSAPVISALVLDASSTTVGETGRMEGSVAFEDPDGDVLELHAVVRGPAGEETPVPPTMVSGARGLTAGRVDLLLAVRFVRSGGHEVEVWLRDAAGHESNRLTHRMEVSE